MICEEASISCYEKSGAKDVQLQRRSRSCARRMFRVPGSNDQRDSDLAKHSCYYEIAAKANSQPRWRSSRSCCAT
jgi:hypothetical protein